MYRIHVFDLDGTILNSMKMWENIARSYLLSIGVVPTPDFYSAIDPMTWNEAIEYISTEFQIEGGINGVLEGMEKLLVDEYFYKLPLFSDTFDILNKAAEDGLPMIIFSNSPKYLIEAGVKRTKIDGYFSEIITTEDVGCNKSMPEAFQRALEMVGFKPEDALVHDDSGYAIEAALNAGCMVKKYDRYREWDAY